MMTVPFSLAEPYLQIRGAEAETAKRASHKMNHWKACRYFLKLHLISQLRDILRPGLTCGPCLSPWIFLGKSEE